MKILTYLIIILISCFMLGCTEKDLYPNATIYQYPSVVPYHYPPTISYQYPSIPSPATPATPSVSPSPSPSLSPTPEPCTIQYCSEVCCNSTCLNSLGVGYWYNPSLGCLETNNPIFCICD